MPLYSSENIPYPELRAINDYRRAHSPAHLDKLRAMIAFGSLVTFGEPYNIYLLEVVEDWSGPRHVSFPDTKVFPLRGEMHLFFLRPEEFEHPDMAAFPGERWSSYSLLDQVCKAYTILIQSPAGYASNILAAWDPSAFAPASVQTSEDPITFLSRLEGVRA